jgi:hypothetical protein
MRHTETVIRMRQQQQTATPATTTKPANADLKEQIKQSIIGAREAAREAQNGARPVIASTPTAAPGGAYTLQNDASGPDVVPKGAVDISIAFFVMCAVMVIGWPIARALGKRLERRSDVPAVSPGMSEQLQRIEQAVDAMAIEIERISESQRFMAKIQSAQKPELKGLTG